MTTPDLAARIAQFENMALSDPDNEMAHYSLGGAYIQAGRFSDAVQSYLRCTELAPGMSKAFQLAGDAAIKANQKDQAVQILKRGYVIASERGDRMPQSAIAELLKSLGQEVPNAPGKVGSSSGGHASGGLVGLGGLGSRGGGGDAPGTETKLDRAPFRGPLGDWILANVSREKWNSWIGQGTKVINELRLDLSREQDAAVYDQHMREFLGIDEAMMEQIEGKKSPG